MVLALPSGVGGVSTHSRLKAAVRVFWLLPDGAMVSTHSRLKAAVYCLYIPKPSACSFNTQPPEGGCILSVDNIVRTYVSTHSRLKAAVPPDDALFSSAAVSTHSRLKAAVLPEILPDTKDGCFNTQPPEGGCL